MLMNNQYLSIQDLFWRTMHGYVGLIEKKNGQNDVEFINDLKSVCVDVSKAKAIGEYRDAFIPLNKNAISDENLKKLKDDYRFISNVLFKNEMIDTSPEDLKNIIDKLGSLMNDLKKIKQ